MRIWENWERKKNGRIDIRNYKEVGTLQQALSIHANEAFHEIDEPERELTKRIFQALTDTDASNRKIRRPTHLSELERITDASADKIMEIIEHFSQSGRSFLVTYPKGPPFCVPRSQHC